MNWKEQTEELIEALNDAQRRMWKICADSIKSLATATADKKWKASIEVTEKVVTSSLRAQAALTEELIKRMATADRMPAGAAESTRSVQAIIHNLVQTQEQLLSTWFDVLKKMDPSQRVSKLSDPLQRMQEIAGKAMDTQMGLLRVWTGQPTASAKKPTTKRTPTRRKKSGTKKSTKKAPAKKTTRKKTTKKKTTRKKGSGSSSS